MRAVSAVHPIGQPVCGQRHRSVRIRRSVRQQSVEERREGDRNPHLPGLRELGPPACASATPQLAGVGVGMPRGRRHRRAALRGKAPAAGRKTTRGKNGLEYPEGLRLDGHCPRARGRPPSPGGGAAVGGEAETEAEAGLSMLGRQLAIATFGRLWFPVMLAAAVLGFFLKNRTVEESPARSLCTAAGSGVGDAAESLSC